MAKMQTAPLPARVTEGSGWQFPEERPVFAGEPAELPEAVSRRDFRHGCRGWFALAQSPAGKMHAAQQQVSLGAHPQLLLAACPQCPVRRRERLAELRDVKRLIGIFLHCSAKPAQDRR